MHQHQHTSANAHSYAFAEGGEMGRRVREFNWNTTALGPIELWPQSLKTSLSIILSSRHPMWIGWGPDLIFLYNDAYISVLGSAKHPHALGRPASTVWAEIWDICGPLADKVKNAESVFVDDVRLFMRRTDYLEESYYSFSYSPIRDENNDVIGLFCPSTSTTDKLLSERRLRTLGELSTNTLVERSIESACDSAMDTLAKNRDDIPFSLLYLFKSESHGSLVRCIGIDKEHPHINPSYISLAQPPSTLIWPIEELRATGKSQLVHVHTITELPLGLAEQPVEMTICMPLVLPSQEKPIGMLIMGINPCRKLDDEYRTFFDLVAGQISGAIQNAKSYEDEKKRTEMLAEIDRAKTLFFSNVSHEFRTPLSLILSPLEDALADQHTPLPSAHRSRLELIQRNSLRLLKLVNSLLDFSRIEANRIQAIFEPTDLGALTADLASVFRSTIEKAGLEYIVDTTPEPDDDDPYDQDDPGSQIFVDREMWEKIVFNLLSNAFKFTLDGQILVSLKKRDRFAVLTVQDSGVGVPEAELPHLFERFHRVEGTKGRSYEGTGIGLALILELVKLHGGHIQAESTLGQGSTFTVKIPLGCDHLPAEKLCQQREAYLPGRLGSSYISEASRWLSDEELSEKSSEDSRPSSPTLPVNTLGSSSTPCGLLSIQARILLADDNADMRQYVKTLLEREFFCKEVIAVANGELAWREALRHRPDIILSDVMMPELDGYGLLRRLREDPRTQAIPFIMLSARAGEEAKIHGLQAGADEYLVKPFSAKELVARVEAHLKITQIRMIAFQREKELLVAAQAARNDLEQVLSNMKDGFVILNHHWEFTYVNQEILHYSSFTRDQVLGQSFWKLFPDLLGTSFELDLRTTMECKKAVIAEFFHESRNRWQENRIYPHPEGICVFSTDITLRKKLEQERQNAIELVQKHQLQRIQESDDYRRKQAEFIDTLCHELRNPLNGIYGGVSLIEYDLRELKRHLDAIEPTHGASHLTECYAILNKVNETITAIDQCAKQQKVIVDDVLDLSKLDNKKVELNPVPFLLCDVVRSIVQMFHPQIQQKNLRFVTDLSDKDTYLRADSHRFTQVITNLLSNAIKFTEQGTICLKTWLERIPDSPSEMFLGVEVSDSGIGMSEEEQTRLFDRFAQANRRTAREFGGSGLGLAISKTLVEAMGGTIIVTSEKGKGSKFRCKIRCGIVTEAEKQQLLQDKSQTSEIGSEASEAHKKLNPGDIHVLIVEDNRLNQKILSRFMEEKGYRFSLVNNGQEALDQCGKVPYDLIFMDVEMPVMNGIDATIQIRQRELAQKTSRRVPIIGLSGNVSEVQMQRGLDAGMDDYLKKPYEKQQVYQSVIHYVTEIQQSASSTNHV